MDVIPDLVKKYETKDVEMRVSWNNYYAYEMSSKWNSETKVNAIG